MHETCINPKERNDLENIIGMLHGAQIPMICVKSIHNDGKLYHYLFVQVKVAECVKYTFCTLCHPHANYLCNITTINATFDETLLKWAHEVVDDGMALLTIIPQ